jgi:soluble lytic murein transglycosylase-like protein
MQPSEARKKEKFADGGNPVIIGENKRMRFCLELILAAVVAGALPIVAAPPTVSVVRVDSRTGKLVRSMVAAPGSTAQTAPDVHGLIDEAAKNFDVNPILVDSVIQVESNYNPLAVSPKGAQGLMQLMPSTAQRFGVTDSFDPKQNIEAGVRYLKFLQNTFQDDRLAIAAYNAGEKAVAKYRDVPPYPETINYVARVGKKYGQAKRAAGKDGQVKDNQAKNEAKNVDEPKAAEEAPRHILGYVDPEGKLHIATR